MLPLISISNWDIIRSVALPLLEFNDPMSSGKKGMSSGFLFKTQEASGKKALESGGDLSRDNLWHVQIIY